MDLKQNFKVEISKELNDKIRWLVNNYEKEIGAWLVGEITNEKIIIEDFLIPYQDVSNVSVDTSGKALVQLRKEYKDRCKRIIGHFHSHNTMTADWSSTDETFMKEFVAPREKAVFIVSSKEDKHKIRLEFNKPIKISLDDLDYVVIEEDSEVGNDLKKEIEKKVIETKPVYSEADKDFWNKENKLTRKEINNMICFDKKTNNVSVRKLSLFQYYQLEGVFPIKSEVYNNGNDEVTLKYFTTEKNKAIELMKDLREYMKNEFKEDDEIDIDEDDINFNQNIGRNDYTTRNDYQNYNNYGGYGY